MIFDARESGKLPHHRYCTVSVQGSVHSGFILSFVDLKAMSVESEGEEDFDDDQSTIIVFIFLTEMRFLET